jgi:hypothetical protein
MEKAKLLGRRILRKIYTALGLTAAALVFQACYGTPQSLGLDVCIQGLVKSKKQKAPVKGIKVSVKDMPQYELTDNYGKFQFYVQRDGNCAILFEDIDGVENGNVLDLL